jgi:myo-inositol-1(or 4)-monophosphatase
MPTQTEIQHRLAAACELADIARKITLPAFYTGVKSVNKLDGAHYDPVTKADTDTEKALRDALETLTPLDGISGEEFPDKPAQNKWEWSLDPIDGTRAFVAGVPIWSTLIAACYEQKPLIGIIDIPVLDERFIGIPGQAWVETKHGKSTLNSRSCPDLSDVILSCTEPSAMFSEDQKRAYERVRVQTRFSRLGLDAYGYALIAAGKMDLVLEAGLQPYDVRALMPVITGAGGMITNWQGEDAKDGGAIICVGDANLLPHVRAILADG